jgi:protein involved in polysaccharide export with SLBB domain
MEQEMTVVVDRAGNITLPSVGVVNVAGLTFKELKLHLKKKFAKYYSGFQLNVTLGNLRTIKIYVVGKAKTPGSYDVSGLSTVINALFATGGPSKVGSMRSVRLLRKNKLVTELDLYDFILKGDTSQDARLEPGDVILIPPIGDMVAFLGNVKDPGIYELKDETRLMDLLESIGGVSTTGYLRHVQVERIEEGRFRKVIDTDLSDFSEEENILLSNGDVIKVFPVSTVAMNKVTLEGNVVRPGDYEWHEGLKISDIIPSRDLKDLREDTLFEFARIERRVPPDFHPQVIHFNLRKAIEKDAKEDVGLQPLDVVTVFNKWEVRERPVVSIAGAVNQPGEYEHKTNMKVSDLVKLAGGLKKYAYNEGELTRVTVTQNGPITERMMLTIADHTDDVSDNNRLLQEDDYLFVRTVPDWHLYRRVAIRGEVLFAGIYTIKKAERFADLVERAGGFTENAYLQGTIFTRKSIQQAQQSMLEQAVDRLEREILSAAASKAATAISAEESEILEAQTKQYQELIKKLRLVKATGRLVVGVAPLSVLRTAPSNIELEDGDDIFVPEKMATVNVMGSVYNPSSYIYDPKTKLDAYVEMAGGPSENADADKTYVIKVNGSAVSSDKIKPGLFGWNSEAYRWEVGGPSRAKLQPGDTIIVPEKVDRLALMRDVKDVTQILFQIAVAAGVIIAAY